MEENGRLVQFLYNEDREVVAEKDCSGNIIRYIRGLGLISSDSENAKTYYHYVSDEQGSVSHIIRDEDKESGVSAQGREQDRILNQYEYDAFGNTISCKEQVENRFRYMGEQYDPLTGQYYLRARYYNPVIARFTQEDTYYGDGLNLYTTAGITRSLTMTRQDMERRRTAHTAGKNSSTLMQGQTRIQQSLQRSAILMQTRNRTYTISTRVRDIMQQMRRSWQTMRLSMVRRGQRTMLPTI